MIYIENNEYIFNLYIERRGIKIMKPFIKDYILDIVFIREFPQLISCQFITGKIPFI